ncbi:hypothetical protein EYC84_006369 [Monilinia fructicola]|uniref:Uncharacterized protein n=1 Tax=Monilinia fructicola TaxID=38448 RepID=A0A5M9K7M9_MONFR|nr:hypothetical protein EYC84_006369 [Monilinia fructicola]
MPAVFVSDACLVYPVNRAFVACRFFTILKVEGQRRKSSTLKRINIPSQFASFHSFKQASYANCPPDPSEVQAPAI